MSTQTPTQQPDPRAETARGGSGVAGVAQLAAAVRAAGFAFVAGADARPLLGTAIDEAAWRRFASSWNDLGLDLHMADRGRYRRRRHAVYRRGADGTTERQAARAHFQSVDYNPLNGGVARWFEPLTEDSAASPVLAALLGLGAALFLTDLPASAWDIEVHQFRIEARVDALGQPTPEGMHRDGVDFVLVAMIHRENIASGTTLIDGTDDRELDRFTLTDPLDLALIDDRRVRHGVTPVTPIDPARPAFRDVLVITWKGVTA